MNVATICIHFSVELKYLYVVRLSDKQNFLSQMSLRKKL